VFDLKNQLTYRVGQSCCITSCNFVSYASI